MINKIHQIWGAGSVILLAAFFVVPVHAERVDDPILSVYTFGTVSLSTSDSDDLGFVRDYQQNSPLQKGRFSYLADSNFGLQLTSVYKKVTGTVQLLARGRIENDLEHLVNYAFIDFHLTRDVTLRLGKNPFELYLSSDNREVGYSQMMVRPVSEFYTLLFVESYPGIDMRYQHVLSGGILTLNGFAGAFDVSFLPESGTSKDYSYDPMAGLTVRYETFESTYLFSYLTARISDLSTSLDLLRKQLHSLRGSSVPGVDHLEESFDLEGAFAHYFIAGISTQLGNWALQSEVNYFLLHRVGNMRLLSGYMSAGYHIGNWTPYGILAGICSRKDDSGFDRSARSTLPEEAAAMVQLADIFYERVSANQLSVGLGLRWDFHPGVAMKFQWGHYWVERDGIMLWKALNEEAHTGGEVDLFSLSLDYAF